MDSRRDPRVPGRITRARTLVVILALALAVFGPAAAAQANTIAARNFRVQPKGTVGTGVPVIVSGSGTFDGYPLDASTCTLSVDGVVVPRSAYVATFASGRNLYLYWVPAPALPDGLRAVTVSVTDTAGKTSSCTWSFTVAQKPSGSFTVPMEGSTNYDGWPEISVTLSDNTPAGLTLAAQVHQGDAAGSVVAAIGTNGLAAGEHNFAVPEELAPGAYTLTATVTDAAGLSAAVPSRSFTVVAAAPMSIFTADCLGCHEATGHVTTGITCAECHLSVYHNYADCGDCHDPHSGPVTVTGSCRSCHDKDGAPKHTRESVAPSHGSSGCQGCHDESLLDRHAVAPEGTAYSFQCSVCHESADPAVKAAIASGNTGCDACHEFPTGHPFPPASHEANLEGEGLSGAWTYVDATAQVDGVMMNPGYPYSAIACLGCHTEQIAGEAGVHSAADASTASQGCAACHPSPRDSFTAWDKTCWACHARAGTHAQAGLGTIHTLAGDPSAAGSCGFVSPINGRKPCHYNDIVQEHNRKISTGVGKPAIAHQVTCEQCHSNAISQDAMSNGWDGTCNQCHDGFATPNHSVAGTARYDEVHALHDNPSGWYDAGFNAPTGTPVEGYNAMDAHGPVRPNYVGASSTIGCGAPTCHTQAYAVGGFPYPSGAGCAQCHGPNTAPVVPYQGSYAWYSGTWHDGGTLTTRLTVTLPPMLPAASVIDFKTWYELETDWDYAYVEVSTDGGTSWTTLAGNLTTTSNPNSYNRGNGLTGASLGNWVDAHYDLSAYAGMNVMVRFSYETDAYVYGEGWFLDAIAIGPSGAPVFTDDAETLSPAWSISVDPVTGAGWSRYTQ